MYPSQHLQAFAVPPTTLLTVLLVEDDPLVRERLEHLIGAAGFTVVSVSGVAEARRALSATSFPIVITDRNLGSDDGLSLCQEVRRLSRGETYVMLLSSLDSHEELARGLAAGADDYLSKRASDDELLIRLRAAARAVRIRRE